MLNDCACVIRFDMATPPPSCSRLLVAVDHNQLQTMASETVEPIDWSHPLLSWAVPPERPVHSINQCSLSRESTLQPSAREATTMPMTPRKSMQWRMCKMGRERVISLDDNYENSFGKEVEQSIRILFFLFFICTWSFPHITMVIDR